MKKNFKILAIANSNEAREEIQAASRDLDAADIEYRVDRLPRVAPTIVNSHCPDVLLVELGLDDPEDIENLEGVIRENGSRLAVIATGREASLEDVRRLMRLGVTDFVPRPVNRKDLMSALETAVTKLSHTSSEPAQPGRVLTFMRASGGVGATTLAVETAAQFATLHKRKKTSVCVVDFDIQFGNVALALDLSVETGIGQVLEAGARVDNEFLRGVMCRHASGLEVLAAPSQILPLETMTPEVAARIIHFARMSYDYTIVDMPYAWTNWTLEVLGLSDALVMVTELDVTSVSRTKRQLDLLEESSLDGLPVAIMLNRYRSGWGTRKRRKEAEKGLGRRFDFVIRNDADTAASARDRGVLISQVRRRSPIVKGLGDFVQTITPTLVREPKMASQPILCTSLMGG